ncbi:hypothetical protein QYE76_004041 [Lolium multiflorum]|uniref:TF-B3 domain-containing protein n=2 Tax=Lolium multiflorum TaxID=4521 RepID=A0AAD8RTP7_LOLMU|nr:hypothetical protein QYE76_004041 [Lolium multiflorum]
MLVKKREQTTITSVPNPLSPTHFTSFTLMTAMNGSPPPSTGSCFADTDEHHRYFLNSADLIHRILQQLDGRPVSSIQIVTREGSTSTSVSYPLAASVPSLAVLSSPLEAPSGSALISLAAAPASPAAPTPTPAARSSPVAAPPKVAMQKQTRSNVNEQLRLRTVDCTCPLHRPEFRIQRNSLAKKPKVTGRRDAAIQRCILKGRGKGRPKRVGHSADPPQPSRFYVQLDGNDDMYMLVIPREFKQCLKGILPRPIKLKTSVGCAWYVHIDEYQGELVLKDGWFGFAEAHELQLDDLLVFEVKDTSLMNVLIYDSNTSTQRIIFCADHP